MGASAGRVCSYANRLRAAAARAMPGQSKLTNAPVRANGDSPGGRSRLRCGEERCKSYLLGLLGLMLPKRLAGSKTGAASASESQRRKQGNARRQTGRKID